MEIKKTLNVQILNEFIHWNSIKYAFILFFQLKDLQCPKTFLYLHGMAMSKKSLFDEAEIDLSIVCKAMGHPARIKIIKILYFNKV